MVFFYPVLLPVSHFSQEIKEELSQVKDRSAEPEDR
jgi:hypothetical protein